MWTLLNKSGRVNTSYWQIHEAFTSKTPHPLFFPHILFISPAETWVCPVRKLRSLGGKYMTLGKEETVFQTKGTGKMASNWDHERRETLHREMYQSKLMLKISDPQHYPSNVNVSNWINCFVLFFCDGSNLTSQHSCRFFVQGCTRCKRVVLPVPLFWSPWAEHVRFSHTDGQFHTKRSSGSNSLRAS